MKNFNSKGDDMLKIKQTIHSIDCDSCSKRMYPEQNKTYYEIFGNNEELHLCSTYCLNKKVSELSHDGSIAGIRFEKHNTMEVMS